MTTTAHRASRMAVRPSGSPVLDRAIDAVEARKVADVALLLAAVEWAEAHPVPAGRVGDYALWEHPACTARAWSRWPVRAHRGGGVRARRARGGSGLDPGRSPGRGWATVWS